MTFPLRNRQPTTTRRWRDLHYLEKRLHQRLKREMGMMQVGRQALKMGSVELFEVQRRASGSVASVNNLAG